MKRYLSISALALAAAITMAGCGSPTGTNTAAARHRQQFEQHAGHEYGRPVFPAVRVRA
ncbi:hypothetical protein [Arthrobacter sp. A5]|uniref:hypothetical protein n=1 Tax=Arthrobacter sp. A5 TaxID=576926 RepID=UPI003DA94E56